MNTDRNFNILFLCTGNSARSIFGEYLMNHFGPEHFAAYSAGADPSGQVNPMTLRVLEKYFQIDASDARSKSWDEFPEQGIQFDFVVTVCDNARESCPVWPGQPIIAHWGSPDPAEFEGSDEEKERYFLQVAMQLKYRIELLCNLPFEKLERFRLEQMTKEIGEKSPEPEEDTADAS